MRSQQQELESALRGSKTQELRVSQVTQEWQAKITQINFEWESQLNNSNNRIKQLTQ